VVILIHVCLQQQYSDFPSGYVSEADFFWKGKKVLVAAVFLGTEQELAGAETRWLEGDCHSPRLCSSVSSVLLLFSSSSPETLPGYVAFLLLQQRGTLLPCMRYVFIEVVCFHNNKPDFSWLVINYNVSIGLEYNNRIM